MRKLLKRLFATRSEPRTVGRVLDAAPEGESIVAAYRDRHDTVAALVAEAADLLRQSGGSSLDVEELQLLSARLDAHRINIVFVGIWSSGKSTLINALLGEHRLPMDIDVESACIARMVAGDGHEMEVRFSDDRPSVRVPQSVENVRNFMSAKSKQRRVEQEVSEVILTTSNRLCGDGAVLVDTPGVEDLNLQRADVTYRFVPQADVVIFLLNAAQAGQLSEITFLKKIVAQQVHDVCFVVNMVDGKDPAEIARVLQSLAGKLKDVIPEPRIFPVSALHALAAKTARVSGESLENAKRRVPALRSCDAQDWESLLVESGVPALESFMRQQFATATRSAAQLQDVLVRTRKRVAVEETRHAAAAAAASLTTAELREMQSTLEQARERRSSYFARAERELAALDARLDVFVTECFGESEVAKLTNELEVLMRSTAASTWSANVAPRIELDLLARNDRVVRAMARAADETVRSLSSEVRIAFEEYEQLARVGEAGRLDMVPMRVNATGPHSTAGLADAGAALASAAAGGAVFGGAAALITVASAAITGPLFPLVALAVGAIGALGHGMQQAARADVARAIAAVSLEVETLFDRARVQARAVARDTTKSVRQVVIDDLEAHHKQLLNECASALDASERELTGAAERERLSAQWVQALAEFGTRLDVAYRQLAEPVEAEALH